MKTQNEVLDKGYKALVDALGVVDATRFIQHFSPGHGNYTKERSQWLDKVSIDDFFAEMQKHKKNDDRGNFEEIIE
jgi:DNA polymerase III alpha subunit